MLKLLLYHWSEGYTLQHIADTFNIPSGTVSDVIVRFKMRGITENKPQSGRPQILVKDERCLVRLVRTNHRTPLLDLTSTFNQNRPTQVSQRTAQRCLYPQWYHRRVVKKKVRVREVNYKKRLNWCRGKMRWNVNGQWDKVIFSDESQVVLGANHRIFYGAAKMKPNLQTACVPQPRERSVKWFGVAQPGMVWEL